MSPLALVTDTHPLVWFLTGEHRKLSKKAKKAFERAVQGDASIWVPTVVLWEISLLIKAERVAERVPLDTLVADHFSAQAIHTIDLLPEDVLRGHGLRFSSDPFDVMIVATALRMECPLITRDVVITESRPCEVYWD